MARYLIEDLKFQGTGRKYRVFKAQSLEEAWTKIDPLCEAVTVNVKDAKDWQLAEVVRFGGPDLRKADSISKKINAMFDEEIQFN